MRAPRKRRKSRRSTPEKRSDVKKSPVQGPDRKKLTSRIALEARSQIGEGSQSLVRRAARLLTAEEFQGLAKVPPEAEWFANIQNPRTRRAYQIDVRDFMTFTGIIQPEEFRMVTRAHVIAWRKSLEHRELAPASMRRRLSALSSLFDHLCESNAVTHNPVRGVKRPKADSNEGKTPAIGDAQARLLLEAPNPDTLKGKRDRAILCVFRSIRPPVPELFGRHSGVIRPGVSGSLSFA